MVINSKEYILKKLEHYCAFQDRCQWEVAKKLYALGVDKKMGDEIISALIETGFLNEERFVNSVVSGKFNINHWGRIKIKHWLKARNIPPSLISNGLNTINENEYLQKLQSLIQKERIRHQNISSSKSKILTLLISKGFESDLIVSELDSLKWNTE